MRPFKLSLRLGTCLERSLISSCPPCCSIYPSVARKKHKLNLGRLDVGFPTGNAKGTHRPVGRDTASTLAAWFSFSITQAPPIDCIRARGQSKKKVHDPQPLSMVALDHFSSHNAARAATTKKYRAFFGCLMFFLLGSVAILTVGIFIFFMPNERAAKVRLYNEAVASFNTTHMSLWAEGGTMGLLGSPGETLAMWNVSLAPTILGSQEGVDRTGFSYLAVAMVPVVISSSARSPTPAAEPASLSEAATNTIDLEFRPHTSTSIVRRFVPRWKTHSYNVMCNATTAVTQCRSVDPNAEFKAVVSPGVCSCSTVKHLTKYCAVVDRAANVGDDSLHVSWVESTKFGSCFYPFTPTDQLYDSPTEQEHIELQLYSHEDPFLVLEQQTQGTHNFGTTISAQHSAALLLILVGIVLGTLSTVGGVLLLNGIRSLKEKEPISPMVVFPTPHVVRTIAWPDTELIVRSDQRILSGDVAAAGQLAFSIRSAEGSATNSVGDFPHVSVELHE